jgi:hypothetical protein
MESIDFSTPEATKIGAIVVVVKSNRDTFGPEFAAWIEANFVIWRAFEREALRIASRRSHYSAKTILEVIRHHTTLAERAGEFKINNNVCPDLARLFAFLHPSHAELFEYRFRRNTAAAIEGAIPA